MKTPLAIVLAALVPLASLAGCESDKAKVSKNELRSIETAGDGLDVGSSLADVRAAFKKGNFIRLGQTMMEGARVEEWKVEAYYDDDWNKSRSQFIKFLYFLDGTLVDISNQRLEFRNPDVVRGWKSNFSEPSDG